MRLFDALVGALYDCPDPLTAVGPLISALVDPPAGSEQSLPAGLQPRIVSVLRTTLTEEERLHLETTSLQAAGWVAGFRAGHHPGEWEPVVTAPQLSKLPKGVRRATGETLVSIINKASVRLSLAAPFIDRDGISVIAAPLAAASLRGVEIQILVANRNHFTCAALDEIRSVLLSQGDLRRVDVRASSDEKRWPHLKLLAADGALAYVGSANFTGRALRGKNAELGVLVRGDAVIVLEGMLASLPFETVPW